MLSIVKLKTWGTDNTDEADKTDCKRMDTKGIWRGYGGALSRLLRPLGVFPVSILCLVIYPSTKVDGNELFISPNQRAKQQP